MCWKTNKKKTNVKFSKLYKDPCSSLTVAEFCESINSLKTLINFSQFVCTTLTTLECQRNSLLVGICLLLKILTSTTVRFEERRRKASRA